MQKLFFKNSSGQKFTLDFFSIKINIYYKNSNAKKTIVECEKKSIWYFSFSIQFYVILVIQFLLM